MNVHTRHEWIAKTGKRISRGGWERLNRAYEVHAALNAKGQPQYRIVGYDSEGRRMVTPCLTYVLARETAKCNRKVSMRNRYSPDGTRSRYLGEPIALTKN